MYRPISFLVALALSCLPAEAGPWPREKGTLFGTLSQDAAHYTSLYLDLGITARTSLTLEAGKMTRKGRPCSSSAMPCRSKAKPPLRSKSGRG